MQIACALFLVLGLLEGDGTILRVGWALTAVAGLLLTLAGPGLGLRGWRWGWGGFRSRAGPC